MDYVFSKHSLKQMKLRGISKEVVKAILEKPEQVRNENGKSIYQSIHNNHLIRIFINTNVLPNIIITVYRTSEIQKYYEG